MPRSPSPELKQFYLDLQQWIDSGYKSDAESSPFNKNRGLCYNLALWTKDKNFSTQEYEKLAWELHDQFRGANLSPLLPFNGPTQYTYTEEKCYNKIYQNQARLDWIKNHATMD